MSIIYSHESNCHCDLKNQRAYENHSLREIVGVKHTIKSALKGAFGSKSNIDEKVILEMTELNK